MARPHILKVAFWIDAGAAAGGGHATRTLTLVDELRARGHHTTVVTREPGAVLRVTKGRLQAGASMAAALAAKPEVWVVDRSHDTPAPPTLLRTLRASCSLLLCFDANDPRAEHCDLQVTAVPPADSAATASARLWGPRYAVVPHVPAGDTSHESPGELVLGFGASDPYGLSEAALGTLAALSGDFSVALIAGPLLSTPRRAALHQAARRLGVKVLDAPRIDAQLFACRAVVLPFGQMLLEAIAHGARVAMWHPSEAHAEVGRRFARRCGDWPCVELGTGVPAAQSLEARVRELVERSLPTRRPVDFRGAGRIVDAIEARLCHDGPKHERPASGPWERPQ